MPNLNIDLNFDGHPKFKKLEETLCPGASILVIRLWAFTGKYFPQFGILRNMSSEALEKECKWWGAKDKCIESLIECEFLDVCDAGYAVHDWIEHQGHIFRHK